MCIYACVFKMIRTKHWPQSTWTYLTNQRRSDLSRKSRTIHCLSKYWVNDYTHCIGLHCFGLLGLAPTCYPQGYHNNIFICSKNEVALVLCSSPRFYSIRCPAADCLRFYFLVQQPVPQSRPAPHYLPYTCSHRTAIPWCRGMEWCPSFNFHTRRLIDWLIHFLFLFVL